MIRDIKLQVGHGAVDEASKTFELQFFLNFKKSPVTLYFNTTQSLNEIIKGLFNFIERLMDYTRTG